MSALPRLPAHGVNRMRRELVAGAAVIILMPRRVRAAGSVLRRVVWMRPAPASPELKASLREALAKHGFVDGRDITIDFQEIHGDEDVRRIIASRPDMIAGPAISQLLLMKRLTRDIPIVFHNFSANPARLGLVETLRRPGGNITGTCHSQHWWGRLLSLLRDIDSKLRIVGVLIKRQEWEAEWNVDDWRELMARNLKEEREKAARHGIELRQIVLSEDSTEEEIAAAVRKSGAQALLLSLMMTEAFVDYLNRTPLPTASLYFFNLRKGVLVCTTYDPAEGAEQAVAMMARILRGESPATIPIYQQTRYETGVNLRTAKRIGLRIPDSLIVQATEIVR